MGNLDAISNYLQQAGTNVSGGLQHLGAGLSEFGKNYHDNIVDSLAGAAVGGGLGAYATDTSDDQTPGAAAHHRMGNILTGALAGGATGASIPGAMSLFKSTPAAQPSTSDHVNAYLSRHLHEAADSAPPVVKDTAKALDPLHGSPTGRVIAGGILGTPTGIGLSRYLDPNDPALREKGLVDRIKDFTSRVADTGTPAVPGSPAVPERLAQYDPAGNQTRPFIPATPEVPPVAAIPPATGMGPNAPTSIKAPESGIFSKRYLTNEEHLAQLRDLAGRGASATASDFRRAGVRVKGVPGKAGRLAFIAGQVGLPAVAYFMGGERPAVPAPPAPQPSPAHP